MVDLIADINMLTHTSMERGGGGVKNTSPWLAFNKELCLALSR